MPYLSQEFLARYSNLRPENAGPLFEITHLTKYSRWLEEEKRRETWLETIQRVVEYNVGLYSGPASAEALVEEAELMFDYLFHLRTYPAGRSLWIAGTEAAKKYGEANFNCGFRAIDDIKASTDIFHLLMCGSGLGYNTQIEYRSKLPTFNTDFSIWDRNLHNFKGSTESTTYNISTTYTDNQKVTVCDVSIGDSKEGWVDSLELFLTILTDPNYRNTVMFVFNYMHIRPAGSRIKTFGGRAAGPQGLRDMFHNLAKVIQASGGTLSSVDCMDMKNIISQNVLSGGVRRSAQIALGEADDWEFINAKVDLPNDKSHRRMSNNSVVFESRPSKDGLSKVLKRIRESWEPGFFNMEAARKRRADVEGTNPCGEILLSSKGMCNLSGTYILSHVVNGRLNYDSLEKSHRLAARIGLRQTNITISLPDWDAVQKRDRLLGVSITGLMDALDVIGWEYNSPEAIDLYRKLRNWANDEADRYSREMGIPRPLLVTCIKPEGTITLLSNGSSCGMHRSYAKYYIRRYKISMLDPVCEALRRLGVPNEPDHHKPDRVVFSFYINSGANVKANDESALSQLDRYITLMRHYVDHNASCTLTVGPEEWEEMGEKIYEHWDEIVAIALANKDFSENTNYTQLPYEAISEAEFAEAIKPNLSPLVGLVNKLEREEYETSREELEANEVECKGSCPIR